MKKALLIFALLSMLCFTWGYALAETGLTGSQGDFATFQLGESQKITTQKYESLVQSNVIVAEETEEKGIMTFSTRFLNEDFDGDLFFENGQLSEIQLSQSRGFSEKQFNNDLKNFIDKTLIPYVNSKYREAQTTYDYPAMSEVSEDLTVVAEWMNGDKRISVGIAKDGDAFYAAIAIDKAAIGDDEQDSDEEGEDDAED